MIIDLGFLIEKIIKYKSKRFVEKLELVSNNV